MSQNTVAISFPVLVDVLNVLTVGDPGCFHAMDCAFVSEKYWCTQSFIPSNDLLQDILTMIIKAEEMSEGCAHTVFLVALCQLSRDPPAAHFSVP